MKDIDPKDLPDVSEDDSDSASEDDSDSGSDSDDGDEDVEMPDESAMDKIMKLERRLESDPATTPRTYSCARPFASGPASAAASGTRARRSRRGSRSTRPNGASGSPTRCDGPRGGGSAGARSWVPCSNAR